ncbi:MAG: hypothetical protein J6T62_00465 [Fibrobacter sp.]|nr:hypothetical protein [Fibrobacter sp.]
MAKTIDSAFTEFMRNSVNLDPQDVSEAKKSKDYLKSIIAGYDGDSFFHLCEDFNEEFGSFARKTKMGVLDDIDLMFGISADGATYNADDNWWNVRVYGNPHVKEHRDCMDEETGLLNSRLVLNKFKNRLGQTYSTSDHPVRDGEAVRLDLKYDWSFDIVPCFQTVNEDNGRNYFLIPNGNGGWKKTDPRKDREFVRQVEKKHNGKVLPLVRLCKKWFNVKKFETPASYLIETLVVRYCNDCAKLSDYPDLEFKHLLNHLRSAIYDRVADMKQIQRNINDLGDNAKKAIAFKAYNDYNKACMAISADINEHNQSKAINLWREIFGQEFPTYG